MGVEPTEDTINAPNGFEVDRTELIERFIASRRNSLSPRVFDNYRLYLRLANEVVGLNVFSQAIQRFIASRKCSNGGKHAYFQCLRAFYNWLFSTKSELQLNVQDNQMLMVEAPKLGKKILPSLTQEQVELLIERVKRFRDKTIISLFADSGLGLTELANIDSNNIGWQNRLIKVKCKGNKEGYAPFGQRTEALLREWLREYKPNDRLWNINRWSTADMLPYTRKEDWLTL